jgi:hypothetical protein
MFEKVIERFDGIHEKFQPDPNTNACLTCQNRHWFVKGKNKPFNYCKVMLTFTWGAMNATAEELAEQEGITLCEGNPTFCPNFEAKKDEAKKNEAKKTNVQTQ